MEAKIYNYKTWIDNTDEGFLKKLMNRLLQEAGFTIINAVEHSYSPQGYTAVWLLAESHLAVHSFPEAGKTYLEISSCNELKNNLFVELLGENCLVASRT